MTIPVCIPGVCDTFACEPAVCRGDAFDRASQARPKDAVDDKRGAVERSGLQNLGRAGPAG